MPWRFVKRVHYGALRRYRAKKAAEGIRAFDRPYRIHVGCGKVHLPGWANVDVDANPGVVDIVWDATDPFPFPDRCCELIYNEHFLEHLSVEKGVRFLAECRRLLTTGGVLRIAMPSLESTVHYYLSDNWRDQDWLTWPAFKSILTRAEMLNASMRWWGHQWVYDREELWRRLREAGFANIRDATWGNSTVPHLCNLETRKESLLICEAVK
jgi:predicted SAM-dependent methyltransferase